jgi:predicted acyltransferase
VQPVGVPAAPLPVAKSARPSGQAEANTRFLPLDAFRGLIMILLVSEGFGFAQLPHRGLYHFVAEQFEHRPWGGAVFYDLIMPAFLFMAGVAMPFALARRSAQGADQRAITRHVLLRCLKLVVISEIMLSVELNHPHLQLHNTLTQVAATYLICYFLMRLKPWRQITAVVLLFVFHSSIYLLFPGPDGAWAQVTNAGARLDRWLMGTNYPWPCVNINFLSETPEVLFGVWVGNLLRSSRPRLQQLKILAMGMVAAFASGLLLSQVVPVNKWLWTASYTLYCTGWVMFGLLALILLVEYAGIRKPMFPLVVVGMNPLFIYCLHELLAGWVDHAIAVFSGGYKFLGVFGLVAQTCSVLAVFWLIAFWMHRRGIFVKV